MPKPFMKSKGEKYIQEKDENNLGIYFWLTKNIHLCFMENKMKIEGLKKRIKFNVMYELMIIEINL